MSRNRRRHTRVRGHGLAAHVRSPRGRTPCVVENISAGGMFVRTDRLEDVGSEIFVDLVRPGWKRQLTVMARVTSRVDALAGHISQKPPGMGLQFQRLEPEHFDRLRKLLYELGAPENEDLPGRAPPRELELKPAEGGDELFDPEPQPLWKQIELVEDALAAPLDPVAFEARPAQGPSEKTPRSSAPERTARSSPPEASRPASIERTPRPSPGAGVDFEKRAPPGSGVDFGKPQPPPPTPRAEPPGDGLARAPAKEPASQPPPAPRADQPGDSLARASAKEPSASQPARAPASQPPRAPAADDTNARLMLQIRGLVMQLSETQEQLAQRDLEIERLRDEREQLRDELDALRAALLAAQPAKT